MHSLWFTKSFWDFSNFFKLNRGEPSLWGEPILKKVWIIWSPILYFNFKSFKDPNSLSFIRFQCILHDWGIPSLNYCGGNQYWRKSELFGPPFCISILKVSRTQILCHSLDLNAFCMIEEYLSQILEICTN